MAMTIASVAWLKDLLPEENRGKFLGIRMIFWIAIPMVIGPWHRLLADPELRHPDHLQRSGWLHPGADHLPGDRGDRCAELDSVDVY